MWGEEASSCCCWPQDCWTDSGDRFGALSAGACWAVAAAVGDEIVVGTGRPEIAPLSMAGAAGHSAAAEDAATGTVLGARWAFVVAFAGIPYCSN